MTELDMQLKDMGTKDWLNWMLKDGKNVLHEDILFYERTKETKIEEIASNMILPFNRIIMIQANNLIREGREVHKDYTYEESSIRWMPMLTMHIIPNTDMERKSVSKITLHDMIDLLNDKPLLKPGDDTSYGAYLMWLGGVIDSDGETITENGAYIKFGKKHTAWVIVSLKS